MQVANMDIRKAIITSGLRFWQVAEKYGINDCNFSKKLRKELTNAEKQRIIQIIEILTKEEL